MRLGKCRGGGSYMAAPGGSSSGGYVRCTGRGRSPQLRQERQQRTRRRHHGHGEDVRLVPLLAASPAGEGWWDSSGSDRGSSGCSGTATPLLDDLRSTSCRTGPAIVIVQPNRQQQVAVDSAPALGVRGWNSHTLSTQTIHEGSSADYKLNRFAPAPVEAIIDLLLEKGGEGTATGLPPPWRMFPWRMFHGDADAVLAVLIVLPLMPHALRALSSCAS
jgi:hypothetical protein